MQHAASEAYQTVVATVVNPKTVSLAGLYGAYDSITHEWQDGLASQSLRAAAMDTTLQRKWLVFDGPIDSGWIENLNTV